MSFLLPLDQLIDTLWILDPADRRALLARATNAKGAQEKTIRSLVKDIIRKQDAFLQKMLTADPAFGEHLRTFLHDAILNTQTEVDALDTAHLSTVSKTIDET